MCFSLNECNYPYKCVDTFHAGWTDDCNHYYNFIISCLQCSIKLLLLCELCQSDLVLTDLISMETFWLLLIQTASNRKNWSCFLLLTGDKVIGVLRTAKLTSSGREKLFAINKLEKVFMFQSNKFRIHACSIYLYNQPVKVIVAKPN